MGRFGKFLLSFVIFVAVCYGGLVWFVNSEVRKGFDQAVADVDGLSVRYDDLSVNIFDHTITLTDVDAALPWGETVQAKALRIIAFDQRNPFPHYVTASATGVVMPVTTANLGGWAIPLRASGIHELAGDVAVDYAYDPGTQELSLKRLAIKSEGLADVSLSGVLTQLDLTALRVERLLGLHVRDASLTFTDHSLVDSLLGGLAMGLNLPASALREQLDLEFASMAKYAKRNGNEVAENALNGFRRYIRNPGTMTVSASPAEPVPVLYFYMGRDFYDNLHLMNVTVETDSTDHI